MAVTWNLEEAVERAKTVAEKGHRDSPGHLTNSEKMAAVINAIGQPMYSNALAAAVEVHPANASRFIGYGLKKGILIRVSKGLYTTPELVERQTPKSL